MLQLLQRDLGQHWKRFTVGGMAMSNSNAEQHSEHQTTLNHDPECQIDHITDKNVQSAGHITHPNQSTGSKPPGLPSFLEPPEAPCFKSK